MTETAIQKWFAVIIGIPAFVWLLNMDWKIGLAVFLMMWANNAMMRAYL